MAEIAGLFTTPEQYQLAQRQAQEAEALQYAKLDPTAQAQYGFYRAGQQLGGAIGGALGGQDPQLQKITQRQQLLGMIDQSNPDSYAQAIEVALRGGDQEAAYLLRNEMMKVKEQAQQQQLQGYKLTDYLTERGIAQQNRGVLAGAKSVAQGLDPSTGEAFTLVGDQKIPLKPLFDPTTRTINEDVANTLISQYGQVGADIVKQRLEGVQGVKSLQVQQLAETLFKDDGTRDPVVEKQLSTTVAGQKILKDILPEARKTITIGNRVLDAVTMNVLYTAPDADPAALAEWKAFSALPEDKQKSFLKLQSAKRPSTTITMPNESERKAAVLSNRLNFSVDQINQAIGIDPSAAMPNTSVEIARFLSRTELIPNKLTSAQRQIVESAQLDILDAALTLGTGAAYTQAQLEGYRKSYFPQIGDKPENVAAKRKRLQNILRSAEIASGRAKVPTPMPNSGANLDSIITAPPKIRNNHGTKRRPNCTSKGDENA